MSGISRAINRQIGLLVDRKGKVQLVIVGQADSIYIPELPKTNKLRGLRLVHTHLGQESLNQEDLMDMLFLRLDCVFTLNVNPEGEPLYWQGAWLNPARRIMGLTELMTEKFKEEPFVVQDKKAWHDNKIDFKGLFEDLERHLAQPAGEESEPDQRAFLVSVSTLPLITQERNLEELAELCKTAGLQVCGRMCQRLTKINPKLILGKGKLAELEIAALEANSGILIFDGELLPAQLHNLADITERKVIDRTQLILDIFSRHAVTRAGKLQVELAQLAYMQPRLAGKNKAMDRLTGGVGGRGPGETKLETDRRKSRERMAMLKRELEDLRRQRSRTRSRRSRNRIPVASLVGYTNAGKSTLLNTLTNSQIIAEDKLFATLDPVTRRLRLPDEQEIIISDTVGFIRNLPHELTEAFRATLEELESAELLIHVVDISQPDFGRQIEAVKTILQDLNLLDKPQILVFNKCDFFKKEESLLQDLLSEWPEAITVSAKTGSGLTRLAAKIKERLKPEKIF